MILTTTMILTSIIALSTTLLSVFSTLIFRLIVIHIKNEKKRTAQRVQLTNVIQKVDETHQQFNLKIISLEEATEILPILDVKIKLLEQELKQVSTQVSNIHVRMNK